MMFAGLLLAVTVAGHDPRCDSVQTGDLIACSQAALARADAALNIRWRKAQAKVTAQDRNFTAEDRASNGGLTYSQALLASQRAWLAYRDKECLAATYANVGGRELPIYQASCRADLTAKRTKELKDFTEGQ